MNKIILAGGSGFLGRVLAKYFAERGSEVVILTREPKVAEGRIREVCWDGEHLGDWKRELEGANAVINLAGRSVDCRYTAHNQKVIVDSRVLPTRVLGEAITLCKNPPTVWLNASTATTYKHSLNRAMTESMGVIGATPEAKDAFSVEVAVAWEKACEEVATPRTRKVLLRTAMVLGLGRNSVFPTLRRLVKCGLGGKMASGEQYVSWIHERDFCRAIEWLITHPTLEGVVNLAAPNPLPNREMMREFREVCGVPFGLPATAWMLELGAFCLRTETELIIKSRRVVPERLLAEGFEFEFTGFREALEELNRR